MNDIGNCPCTACFWMKGKSDPTSAPVGATARAAAVACCICRLRARLVDPAAIGAALAIAVACRKRRRFTRWERDEDEALMAHILSQRRHRCNG